MSQLLDGIVRFMAPKSMSISVVLVALHFLYHTSISESYLACIPLAIFSMSSLGPMAEVSIEPRRKERVEETEWWPAWMAFVYEEICNLKRRKNTQV